MNEYEILLMLDADLPEERGNEIIARLREQVERDGGSWDGHEPWGRRKLAYEIRHKGEGVYHLLLFKAAPATLTEITRVLKITDGVMRHGAYRRVKGGGHLKAPSQIPAPQERAHEREEAAPAPREAAAVAETAPEVEATPEVEAEPEPELEVVAAPAAASSEAADDTDGTAE